MKTTKALLSVLHAAHKDVTRYAMHGVFLEADGAHVATNGKILATLRATGVEVEHPWTPRVLHRDSVKALRSALGSKGSAELPGEPVTVDVSYAVGKKKAFDRGEGVETPKGPLQVRHVAGHFPPWREAATPLRDPAPIVWEVDRTVLEDMTAPFTQFGEGRACRWSISTYGEAAHVDVRARHEGKTLTLVAESPSDGKPLEIGMDPSLTLALCRVAKDAGIKTLKLGFRKADTGVTLEGKTRDLVLFAIQMPLNP